MCLTTVEVRIGVAPPYNDEKEAYKVFSVRDRKLEYEFGSGEILLNTWLQPEYREVLGHYYPYKSGFHAFVKEADANEWCEHWQIVLKVKVRGIYIMGTQNFGKGHVVVAEELFIPTVGNEYVNIKKKR